MSETRFAMMESRQLECRCQPAALHCSPDCEACRVYGITRVHPRRDYNRRADR